MANFIERDQKRRRLLLKYELKRVQLKSILNNISLSKEKRYDSVTKLNNLSRNSSKVRVLNRCVLTGRGKAVYRFCRLSRIKMREFAARGLLPGVKKSSW